MRLHVNDDPERWGYHLLGLEPLVDAAHGFPVVEADVELPVEGYLAELGWVQVVWTNDDVIVDRAPQLLDTGCPYVTFGLQPSFFDAPSTTEQRVVWRARTFLTSSPDLLMTKVLEPVLGFTWGYDVVNGRVAVVGVELASEDDWRALAREIRRELPQWELR